LALLVDYPFQWVHSARRVRAMGPRFDLSEQQLELLAEAPDLLEQDGVGHWRAVWPFRL